MGKWAEKVYGRESFDGVGIVIAGTINQEIEKEILSLFDKVLSSKDVVYHAFLVKKRKYKIPLITNVYGAPAMLDSLAIMHDGGCNNIIFIGSAYGFNLDVGSVVLIDKSYHFDGIYHPIEPDRKTSKPDKELFQMGEVLFKKMGISFCKGTNISVPAVTFQPKHANKEYQSLKPATLEMELAACFSRAKDFGMRAVGILVISDTRKKHIKEEDSKKKRNSTKMEILKILTENFKNFDLKPKEKMRFNIDAYLASVIEDPAAKENIYRDRKI